VLKNVKMGGGNFCIIKIYVLSLRDTKLRFEKSKNGIRENVSIAQAFVVNPAGLMQLLALR
jgi:hypothetical protein